MKYEVKWSVLPGEEGDDVEAFSTGLLEKEDAYWAFTMLRDHGNDDVVHIELYERPNPGASGREIPMGETLLGLVNRHVKDLPPIARARSIDGTDEGEDIELR